MIFMQNNTTTKPLNQNKMEEIKEREKEILSYQRAWFWGGNNEQYELMKKLLERIYYLEDIVKELKLKSK